MPRRCHLLSALLFGLIATLTLSGQELHAGALRDRLAERHAHRQAQPETPSAAETRASTLEAETGAEAVHNAPAALPAGVQVVRDVPYGGDPRQRFDVYSNGRNKNSPTIFMVHGGGWRNGSKSEKAVVENKVARWVPKGFIVISTNYRLLPQTDPIEQARDVARALATAQDKAAGWGGDRNKFILMGHSAGAHLVALLTTAPTLIAGVEHPPTPWLGTIALDSAAYNIVEIMTHRHLRLYDDAFGSDHDYWKAASPFFAVTHASWPILAVCSTRREGACRQAHQFAAKARTLGVTTTVLEKDDSHRGINLHLGEEPRYTAEVEAFMAQLLTNTARDSR